MTESAPPVAPLDGRTVVITGASDGIGATALTGDFARLEDVRRIAGEILARCPRIDVLACNAGAMFPKRVVTADGNEMTFQVNYLAGFLLAG